jgi:hypothetical protein
MRTCGRKLRSGSCSGLTLVPGNSIYTTGNRWWHPIAVSQSSSALARVRRSSSSVAIFVVAGCGYGAPDSRNHHLVYSDPEHVAKVALEAIDVLVAVGKSAMQSFRSFTETLQVPPPSGSDVEPRTGEALVWFRKRDGSPIYVKSTQGRADRRRHLRLPDKAFTSEVRNQS